MYVCSKLQIPAPGTASPGFSPSLDGWIHVNCTLEFFSLLFLLFIILYFIYYMYILDLSGASVRVDKQRYGTDLGD